MNSSISSAVLNVVENSKLTANEQTRTIAEAVSIAEAAQIEGYREVINAAHKVGLTAGKARAKKDLLGNLRTLTSEQMFALAFGESK